VRHSDPQVTVVLPVKNGERYLADSIDSVLAQTGVAFEVAVYDNGSTDATAEIVARYVARDPRVRYTRNDRDLHVYGSMNRGIAESSTPYVAFFTDDDAMEPGNLACKVDALEATDAAFSHSTCTLIDAEDNVIGAWPLGLAELPQYLPAGAFVAHLLPDNETSLPSVVARRSALAAVGGFDGRLTFCGDWHLWVRLAARFGVVSIAEPLVRLRFHASSGTSDSRRTAVYASQLPSAIRSITGDPAMPEDVRRSAALLEARVALSVRARLLTDGHRLARVTGYSGYAAAIQALLLCPENAAVREAVRLTLRDAGLPDIAPPFSVVAAAPGTSAEAASLVATLRGLRRAGAGAIALVTDLDDATTVLERIGPTFDDATDLECDLLCGTGPERVMAAGALFTAPFASEVGRRVEALGYPVLPYGEPDPLDGAVDPSLWHRLTCADLAA
jgi:hypothetical protein